MLSNIHVPNLNLIQGKDSSDQHDKAVKPFKCQFCDYSTIDKVDLNQHINMHISVNNYKCPYCNFTTTWTTGLTNHLKVHCSQPLQLSKEHLNQQMLIDLNSHISLNQHNISNAQANESNDKPFRCPSCLYRTSKQANLTAHLRTHSNENPHKCNYCDFTGSDQAALTQHLSTHTAEKPYECTFCEYRANQKWHLTRHLSIHTGHKPYKCNYCDYRAHQKWHLTRHLSIHTGWKPYICTFCDYKASQKWHLTRHLKTHSKDIANKYASDKFSTQPPQLNIPTLKNETSINGNKPNLIFPPQMYQPQT